VRRRLVILAVLAALLALPAGAAAATTTELMPGITYTREVRTIDGKIVVVHVVAAAKPGGLYDLQPVLSNGTVVGRETVTEMQRALASQATTVGVNGDLFDYRSSAPSGILLRDGALISRPTSSRSSLAVTAEGLLQLGRVGFFGRWAIAGGMRHNLTQLNRPLTGNGAALFTPAWGPTAPDAGRGVDVVLAQFPAPAPNTDLTASVVETRDAGPTPIPPGGAVLRVAGPLGPEVAATALPGAEVVVRLGLKPWWDDVVAAMGGGPALVENGRVALPTTEAFSSSQLEPRAPRTAVGQLRDGRILFVTVDGRSTQSAGVTIGELARELVRLGAVTAIALDSGGSTTLAFEGQVLNAPSDGAEREVANALMVFYYGVYAPPPTEAVVSPNGDGEADAERLAYKVVRPSTVKARLVSPKGKVVWKQEADAKPGTFPFEPDPALLKQGKWRWIVSATDADGMKSKAERTFVVNNTLGFLELSQPTVKVTRKRGGKLGISFRVTEKARVTVSVVDGYGRLVRTLLGRWQSPGKARLVWDGRAQGGQVVLAGRYVVRVEARNRLGTVTLSEPVTVKRRK
jgi:hypothetical protein